MTAWKETTFSDLGQCIRGVSYKPHNLREASGTKTVTLLRSNNIRDGRLNFHDVQYVEAHTVRPEQHLKHSDIAVCMSNGNRALVGKAGQFDEPSINTAYTVGAFCSIYRPTADYESDFVLYQFNSPLYQQQLDSLLAGSAINNLKGSDVAALKALVPTCRHEQSKIAEVLSTMDRAIEQTEALFAKQQRIKTGLMQDLLTRGIDKHDNLRSEQTHEFKDSSLGRIPVAWAVSSIGAEFDIQLGKMLSQASRQSRTPLPYLGNKNVQWDNVDLTSLERMDFDEGERKKFRLKSGDILVCEGGEVGRTCVWREELEVCFYQKAIHRLRPKRGYIPSLFPTYMRWAVRNGLLSDFTSQSSIAHLTKEKLASVPMCVPSESEQMRISCAMETIDRGLALHRQQLAKLQALKHGLMQDLLTGNRRVTPLFEKSEGVTT